MSLTNTPDAPFTRVLVPVDFSSHSEGAWRHALALARQLGLQIELLHVVEDPIAAGAWGAEVAYVPSVQEILDDLVKSADRRLSEMKDRPVAAGVAVTTRVAVGSPSRMIVERAEEGAFDLIVMGTHGRTGLSHLVMGSVAERVVRRAPCPVLTVRDAAVSDPGAAEPAAAVSK